MTDTPDDSVTGSAPAGSAPGSAPHSAPGESAVHSHRLSLDEWVEKIRAGEQWDEFKRSFRGIATRAALTAFNWAPADEIEQSLLDAYVFVWQGRLREPHALLRLIEVIAARTVLKQCRHEYRRVDMGLAANRVYRTPSLNRLEIEKAAQTLNPLYRSVALAMLAGADVTTIAKEFCLDARGAWNVRHRSLQKLRKRLLAPRKFSKPTKNAANP